jgi:hypothetical protein
MAKIVENQIKMQTGAIVGLGEREKRQINVLYQYLQRGERGRMKEEDYLEYKLVQDDTRKHPYNDTIFQLVWI